jgi:hypothetical protein
MKYVIDKSRLKKNLFVFLNDYFPEKITSSLTSGVLEKESIKNFMIFHGKDYVMSIKYNPLIENQDDRFSIEFVNEGMNNFIEKLNSLFGLSKNDSTNYIIEFISNRLKNPIVK